MLDNLLHDLNFVIHYLTISGASDVFLLRRLFLHSVFKLSIILFSFVLFFFVVVRPFIKYIKNSRQIKNDLFVNSNIKCLAALIAALVLEQFQSQIVDFANSFAGDQPTKPLIMDSPEYERYNLEQKNAYEITYHNYTERIRRDGLSKSIVSELVQTQNFKEERTNAPSTPTNGEQFKAALDYLAQSERHRFLESLLKWLGSALTFGFLYVIIYFIFKNIVKRFGRKKISAG